MNQKLIASAGLSRKDLPEDPVDLFARWYAEAEQREQAFPEAMALATVGSDGKPSVRMVLLRGFDKIGFRFFTNYDSRKSRELAENSSAALVFYWHVSGRQVRLEGEIEKLPAAASDAYFASRPRGSQLGAWASAQSRLIENRSDLENAYERFDSEFENKEIPRPSNWGGYQLIPQVFEFWQSRENRMHDRFAYHRTSEKNWKIERLAP